MDIPSIIFTYGGPSGFLGVILFLFLLWRKHSDERREEIRRDYERVRADLSQEREESDRLRELLEKTRGQRDEERRGRITAEDELRRCRANEVVRGEVLP